MSPLEFSQFSVCFHEGAWPCVALVNNSCLRLTIRNFRGHGVYRPSGSKTSRDSISQGIWQWHTLKKRPWRYFLFCLCKIISLSADSIIRIVSILLLKKKKNSNIFCVMILKHIFSFVFVIFSCRAPIRVCQ